MDTSIYSPGSPIIILATQQTHLKNRFILKEFQLQDRNAEIKWITSTSLKTLYDKTSMAIEIACKLKTDANNGFLLNSQELIRFLRDIQRIRIRSNQQQDSKKGSFQ